MQTCWSTIVPHHKLVYNRSFHFYTYSPPMNLNGLMISPYILYSITLHLLPMYCMLYRRAPFKRRAKSLGACTQGMDGWKLTLGWSWLGLAEGIARRPNKGLAGQLWITVFSQSGLFLTREINKRNTHHQWYLGWILLHPWMLCSRFSMQEHLPKVSTFPKLHKKKKIAIVNPSSTMWRPPHIKAKKVGSCTRFTPALPCG